jgi:type III restriction enzyme
MPTSVVIENPILNSPYREPSRHFRFSDEGITNEIVDRRRVSSYFIPIPAPKKRGAQLSFDTEWTRDHLKENDEINRIRDRVSLWRRGGYVGITSTTRRLLDHWQRPDCDRPLFFCQHEALETAIYITEVAAKYGDGWILDTLRSANASSNPGLFRLAFKMATGSGKTVVMAMLIAYHALNKLANPQSNTFSDAFLIVTSGITIRDRLRVLLPNDPANYYRAMDLVPSDLLDDLHRAKIVLTNFHAFQARSLIEVGKLTKSILAGSSTNSANDPFTESPDQMVNRVLRELGKKRNIVVINDEAHHCYRRKLDDPNEEKLVGDDRKEAEQRAEEARVWISGIEAVTRKLGTRAVYDLSATPFFLRGSGYPEGTLFPWVVSDFSLIDAIESGIVKVPRVPVSDDSMTGPMPTYRDLWVRIRDDLPKKGRKTDALALSTPTLPVEFQGALHSLYSNYEKYYKQWQHSSSAKSSDHATPPVFIIVCNNTNVSKLVFDYIAGYERPLPDNSGTIVVPGALPLFSNELNGSWSSRPNTILVDSQQLESGEGMSDDFKKIAAREIEEFKADYRARFPGRDADDLTDEDLLREVMNTVGKPSKLGEQVKCVVSVSMLTEGWDANTVTHILGVRAFSTQLLCEQVVGRGLRRISYAPNADGMFDPEYAEVYGVPFSFIPVAGTAPDPKPGRIPTRVRALPDRAEHEITFPRLIGYRYELPAERIEASFTPDSRMTLSTATTATITDMRPIVGEATVHTLDDLQRHRLQEVAFHLAKHTLEKYFTDADGFPKPWLFPQLVSIARDWLSTNVVYKDNTFPQILLLHELAHEAADKIYQAITHGTHGEKLLKPILRPYDTVGSTRYVDFDTTRDTYPTSPYKCHVSHVVADSTWEQHIAQSLEAMPEVVSYVKNHNLSFYIPYTIGGQSKNYIPDFIVRLRDRPSSSDDLLNLILEVSGRDHGDKATKVATARNLWVPAVNNHALYGRGAFLEITDPNNTKTAMRAFVHPTIETLNKG